MNFLLINCAIAKDKIKKIKIGIKTIDSGFKLFKISCVCEANMAKITTAIANNRNGMRIVEIILKIIDANKKE